MALKFSFGRGVLEVGCTNGVMLQQWGADWTKSGIEPSMASAAEANQRGIDVVASSINNLKCAQWDCIVSVDTNEYINDLMSFYSSVKKFLAPGGIIITLPGDMSYRLARLAAPRYWYSSFSEHVGFLVPSTYSYIAKKLNGHLVFSKRYSWGTPGRFNTSRALFQLAKYIIAFLGISLSRLIGANGLIARKSFPVMDSHYDHLLTVI